MRLAVTTACFAILASTASAEPRVPADDDEVLEVLPRNVLGTAELDRPDDPARAAAVARRLTELGKASGDVRQFGYARAAIGEWWDAADPPVEVRAVRAELREVDHDYVGAAEDLRAVLAARPDDAQAWLELSNVLRVTGDLDGARRAATELETVAGQAAAAVAWVPIWTFTGDAERSAAVLDRLDGQVPATLTPWLTLNRAAAAEARGDPAAAEAAYRLGLAATPADGPLLRGFGHLLLTRGDDAAVLAELGDHTDDTGVLLLVAIAADRLGDPSAEDHRLALGQRFDEIRLRGGTPHGRFEARYHLELLDDPARALELARANWQSQRETADAWIVLRSAEAAGEPAAEVRAFLDAAGNDDATLRGPTQ